MQQVCGSACALLLFSHQVMSDSSQPHGLQYDRLPCPSPFPGVCSNSCQLRRWYCPTISSSVIFFSSCLQSFPASESFPMGQLFVSGGQSIGASTSASVLPVNIQDWFLLRDHQGSPLVSFKNSLYILDNSPLADVSFVNIFSQSVAVFSSSWQCVLQRSF